MYDENCPLCRDPVKSASWVRLILNYHRTALECAEQMGMTPEAVNEHVYHHVSHESVVHPDNPEYVRLKMVKFADILELWLDGMIIDNNIERGTMDMALRLIKEIRENLKVIAEMNGDLNRADPKLQIINITNDFKKLTNVLMMDLCDQCKPKALKAIEGMSMTVPVLPGGK